MASRSKRSGPTKFDAAKAKKIVASLAAGNFITDAAALVRVDQSTVHRWIERGTTKKEEPYAEFAADVAAARSKFASESLKDILSGTVRANGAKWILEKTRPRQFGDRVRVHVDLSISEFLDKLKDALDPSVYERILEITTGDRGEATPTGDPVE